MKYFFLFLILISCDEVPTDIPTGTFDVLIKKDSHESSNFFNNGVPEEGIKLKVQFDESVKYKTQELSNQGDINKLIGFSDCSSHHHTNSARIGWNWRWFNDSEGEIRIFSYVYREGERTSFEVAQMLPNQEVQMSISIENNDTYRFKVQFDNNSFEWDEPRGCKDEKISGYLLRPYFGGDETAPHDIKIKLTF